MCYYQSRAGRQDGFCQIGGTSRCGLVYPNCPLLSVLGLSRLFFQKCPDFEGICLISPFPLSLPIKSTYKDHSRKGLRHNQDLSRKNWEPPPSVWETSGLPSLQKRPPTFNTILVEMRCLPSKTQISLERSCLAFLGKGVSVRGGHHMSCHAAHTKRGA